uniref:Uncharacterized protein n=1 Tax=Rhizophora mucronata TaxID=61149 RepID=A0A2P2NEL7_RHIMU
MKLLNVQNLTKKASNSHSQVCIKII